MTLTRGQRLLRLRTQAGVDQKDVAAAIGVSRPYVSHLEHAARGRHLDHIRSTLERAARYFGVVPEYLLADTPQEYMAAWAAITEAPPTFGGKLRAVLDELHLRWGDDYTVEWLASGLGCTPTEVKGYLADSIPVTASAIEQVSVLTGVPVIWLTNRSEAEAPAMSQAYEKVISKAIAGGMEALDLEALVDAWLMGRNAKKPSG